MRNHNQVLSAQSCGSFKRALRGFQCVLIVPLWNRINQAFQKVRHLYVYSALSFIKSLDSPTSRDRSEKSQTGFSPKRSIPRKLHDHYCIQCAGYGPSHCVWETNSYRGETKGCVPHARQILSLLPRTFAVNQCALPSSFQFLWTHRWNAAWRSTKKTQAALSVNWTLLRPITVNDWFTQKQTDKALQLQLP